MSLPPAHINIKRRRQDDPVELLYLQSDCHQPKRRFTEYCFKRIDRDTDTQKGAGPPSTYNAHDTQQSASTRIASGIPIVRATSPGASVHDEAKRRAAQEQLRSRVVSAQNASKPAQSPLCVSPKASRIVTPPETTKSRTPLRQFRLSHGSRADQSSHPSGIRKRKKVHNGWHATIIEKIALSEEASKLNDITRKPPPKKSGIVVSAGISEDKKDSIVTASPLVPRPPPPRELSSHSKAGQSIHDHPSTWDHGSDQLGQELAAFAAEISGEQRQAKPALHDAKDTSEQEKSIDMDLDQGFIYDTYIRVPIHGDDGTSRQESTSTNDVGLLVIEDEDQDLWQTFADSDSDTEWDEEDPDSNAEDNPANDYPDEEMDSEDEYGHAGYCHRRFASDNEEYDLSRS